MRWVKIIYLDGRKQLFNLDGLDEINENLAGNSIDIELANGSIFQVRISMDDFIKKVYIEACEIGDNEYEVAVIKEEFPNKGIPTDISTAA